uniref:Neurotransmitter-gated ion-channel ligand-binding domain-containing protein n=1 Tax=Plectus sambesii TaxID=2011161 RepID=A0A914WL76_9BILA
MLYFWIRNGVFLLLFVVYCHMAIDFNETEIVTIIERDNDTAIDLCLDCSITDLLDLNDTESIDKTGEDQPIGIDVSKLKIGLGEIRSLIANASVLESSFNDSAGRDYGGSYILPVLKAVQYDNNTAPSMFTDQPVQVRVGLYVISLSSFDSSKMEYSIDIDFEMRWIDFRLANNYSRPIGIKEKEIIDQIWRPDPYFVNSKKSYFHAVSFPNFRMRIRQDGLIVYNMRVTLLPACQMVFCRFPHDQQVCDLKISSRYNEELKVLLTLVQLQRGDDQIPRVSYLTSMDLWFSAMKFFSVLSLVESLAVLALIKRSRAMEKEGKRTKSELEREWFLAKAKSLNKLYHSLDNGRLASLASTVKSIMANLGGQRRMKLAASRAAFGLRRMAAASCQLSLLKIIGLHLALYASVVGYLALGGLAFLWIEGGAENAQSDALISRLEHNWTSIERLHNADRQEEVLLYLRDFLIELKTRKIPIDSPPKGTE